jgi:hypothetical protein
MTRINTYSAFAMSLAIRRRPYDKKMLADAGSVESYSDLVGFVRLYLSIGERAVALRESRRLRLRRTANQTAVGEILSIDGNTVQKLGTRNIRRLALPSQERFLLEFWTDDYLSKEEEAELRESVEALIRDSFKLEQVQEPMRGSFYQAFQLAGVRKYFSTLLANLRSAFGVTVTNQNAEVVLKLSKIVEKHQNVVVRVDDIVAIKFTRNKQSYVLIEVIPPHLKEALALDPSLVSNPARIYDLFQSPENVVSLPSRPATPSLPPVPEDPTTATEPAGKTGRRRVKKA